MTEALLALRDVAWAAAGVFLALISGAVAIYGGVRFGLVPGVQTARRTLGRFEAAAALIEAQLTHNAGSSLLDRVRRIDERLTEGCPLFGDSGVCPLGHSAGEHLPQESVT